MTFLINIKIIHEITKSFDLEQLGYFGLALLIQKYLNCCGTFGAFDNFEAFVDHFLTIFRRLFYTKIINNY